jgi:transposase-like protein
VGPRKAWTKVSVSEIRLRNRVERFFGYLKQRTRRFHNNINSWKAQSMQDYAKTIAMIRNLITLIKTQGGVLLG